MRVLYTQRRPADADVERTLGATYLPIGALLGESDVVVLSCPLNDDSRGLLSRERLALLKPGAVVVSTSRGACLDEVALAEALRSGRVSAAGLDVYAREPHVSEALLACENVVLAPHLGSADRPTREAMASICAEAVLAVLAGQEPRTRVA